MFNKHRIEALSDGIFAIVMTLLVLDLKVPEGVLPPHFRVQFVQQWISFALTFIIASIFWMLQHRVFELMENIHRRLLVPTFLFLGFVSVLPFSTSLLGHRNDAVAFSVYYANQLLIALALTLKLWLGTRGGHVAVCVEATMLRLRLYSMCVVMLSGMLSAAFLPIHFVWVAPVILGVASKRFRKYREGRLLGQPALP